MKWEPHYTGIEIWNPSGTGEGWYVQRDRHNKRITFIRYSRRMFGFVLFKGWLNYLKEMGGYGFEFATLRRNFGFGLSLPHHWWNPSLKRSSWRRFFQGYRKNRVVCARVWWFCLTFSIPRFLADWLQKRKMDNIEKEMNEFYRLHPEEVE
jgi:hypothetical protein